MPGVSTTQYQEKASALKYYNIGTPGISGIPSAFPEMPDFCNSLQHIPNYKEEFPQFHASYLFTIISRHKQMLATIILLRGRP